MNVILMLGGGGSLGAFDGGVWRVLAERLHERGARLTCLAGASIGAVNAALLAGHGQDLRAGAEALEAAWRDRLRTPSAPFAGCFGGRGQASWNGVLTGMLLGNRALYRPHPPNWSPLAALDRLQRPLTDRAGMLRWLEEIASLLAESRPADAPLVCVPAVDVASGELRLFDNADAPLSAAHLAAASALPLMFDPVEVDGRCYWDGDVTRDAALPRVLERLRELGRLSGATPTATAATPTLLVTVDHMSRRRTAPPQAGLEITVRALELLLRGKMELPAAALAGVSHTLHIVREPMEHDGISGQLDYSPERIDELVEQGAAQAASAWDAGMVAVRADPAGR